MTIILETYDIPTKGLVNFKVDRSFNIKITAEEARRQTNHWLWYEVNHLLSTDMPTLAIGQEIVWRIPVWLGFPNVGRLGTVGVVEVDVYTGIMNNTPKLKDELEQQSEELASRLSAYQPVKNIPQEYLATDIPSVPQLIVDDENKPLTEIIPA